jgi:hypothetical protein
VQNYNISWNGFSEEYPIVDPLPYHQGTDDSSGGYGDGFGTATVLAPAPGWQVHFDQGVCSYNTQDCLDALHLRGHGSKMTVTRSLLYGSMGQQIKIGGGADVENNIIETNCFALRQAIPGTPAGYNAKLSDYCRAGQDGIAVETAVGAMPVIDNNTIYSANATVVDFECDTTGGNCDDTSLVDFRNNALVLFLNNATDGVTTGGTNDYANPIYNGVTEAGFPNPFTNPGSLYSDNSTFHYKSSWKCPAPGETDAMCNIDPKLTDETWHLYGYADATPTASSPLIGLGLPIAGLTTDFYGNPRSAAAPTIGAVEYVNTVVITPPPIQPPPVQPPPVTPPACPVTAATWQTILQLIQQLTAASLQ